VDCCANAGLTLAALDVQSWNVLGNQKAETGIQADVRSRQIFFNEQSSCLGDWKCVRARNLGASK
jgi:hypothetical protein